MALYPHDIVRVSLEGSCYGGAEIWQTGFWLGNPTQNCELPTAAKAQGIAEAFSQFFTNSSSGVSNRYQFNTVRMSVHALTGGIQRDDTVIYDLPVPAIGTAIGSTNMPPQIATVATLTTNLPRGRASKGRMFLPVNGFGVGTTGTITNSQQTAVATNLAAFLGAVDVNWSGEDDVVNVSPVKLLPPYAGRIEIVMGVRVGNVYDTQRRRRNDIGETYVNAPLTP